jgi:hypothetical protein
MNTKTKILIMTAAVLITLLGFNLICGCGFFCYKFRAGLEQSYAYLPPGYRVLPAVVVTAAL